MVKYYLSSRPDKNGENPIRVSISIKGVRMLSTIGYNVNPLVWNKDKQRVKKGYLNRKGISGNIINARLKEVDSFFSNYEIGLRQRPTAEDLSERLARIKGKERRKSGKARQAKTALEYFDKFVREENSVQQWADGTLANWKTFRRHLLRLGRKTKLTDFDDKGLSRFLDLLRNRIGLSEASVQKEYIHLRRFLNWSLRRGLLTDDSFINWKPRFKITPKPVIFLTKEELLRLYKYKIPHKGAAIKLKDTNGNEYIKVLTNTEGLGKARDFFCFCAFTSLRYSDAVALKKSDIDNDSIKVVTRKTLDALRIDLNDYSRSILSKYRDDPLPDNAALPYLSIATLDSLCKTLGELCGFNEPITRTLYKGGRRMEVTEPKWKYLSSHAGRRTFICYALSVGIPPQVVMKWTGHSDYKAMKPYIDIAENTRVEAMKKINSSLFR